jgi:hypothetical protein
MSEGITVVLEYAGNSSDRINSKTLAGGAVNDIRLGGDTCFTIVMLSVFALVGSTGNAIVLCVMSSRRDKLTSTMFIMVLAAVDFMTCVFIVPFTVAMEWVNFRISSDFVCRLYIFLTTFNIPFSSLLVASIAVDRYLCICHPFWHKANVTRFRWIIGIAVLWLSSGGFGLTVSLMHSVYAYDFSVDMDDGNITTLEMWRRSDNNNSNLRR